jgi:hypothetical protein
MTPAACPRCGAATFLGARFCRRCGCSLDAEVAAVTETVTVSEVSPPSVGETVTATEVAPPPRETRVEPSPRQPAKPAPAPPPPGTRRGRKAVVIGGIAAIFVLAASATYVLRGADDDTLANADRAVQEGGRADAGIPTPTVTAAPTPEPASPTDGRFLRLGSFRYQSAAQRLVDTLQSKGIDARIIASDDANGMFPAFFQVIQGPLSGDTEERRALRLAKRAGVVGPFVDDLSPVADERPPARALAGEFAGALRQNNAKVKRLNRKLATTMSFADDGRTGTIAYDRPRCAGTLTRVTGHGHSFAFREQIDSGRCVTGGTWHLRLQHGRLWATWWRPDDVTFVIGTLER